MPTLVAGVYGMNFEHMPELQLDVGYPFDRADAGDLRGSSAFRRNGWL